jgi:hypothetical protein
VDRVSQYLQKWGPAPSPRSLSAWAVAVRDAPAVAEQLLDVSFSERSERPLRPVQFRLLGDLEFFCQLSGGEEPPEHLSTRTSVEKLVAGSHGVDIPPFEKLRDFKTWEEEKPPAGTLYNYPPRGDVTALLAGYAAPTSLGAQMFAQGTICKMVAQCTQQGRSIDQAIEFAQSELEGFMRT